MVVQFIVIAFFTLLLSFCCAIKDVHEFEALTKKYIGSDPIAAVQRIKSESFSQVGYHITLIMYYEQ
jgi:hypothetical protein